MATCVSCVRSSVRARAFQRTHYEPGELVQFDLWEPSRPIPVGHGQLRRGWVVSCCSGYSRASAGALVFSKEAPDLLWGMRRCLQELGALPGKVVWEGAIHRCGGQPTDAFPTLRDARPQRAWGGWIPMTPSWLPVAGEAAPNVCYAVGYNGHGLAQAPYLGTLVADRLAGDEPHGHLRVVWCGRPRFAPSPFITGPGLKAGWTLDRVADRLIARRAREPGR